MRLGRGRGAGLALAAVMALGVSLPAAHAEDVQPTPDKTGRAGVIAPSAPARDAHRGGQAQRQDRSDRQPGRDASADERATVTPPSSPPHRLPQVPEVSETPDDSQALEPTLPYTGSTALPNTIAPAAPLTKAVNGQLRFGARQRVGHGWPAQGGLMLNDLTGNHQPDVLMFFVEDGIVKIRLYEGRGRGHIANVGVIGHNWNSFDYVTAGDVNGDGRSDLIARKANGELWLYTSAGRRVNDGVKIGWGWDVMRSLTYIPAARAEGASIMATDHSGRLYRYPFASHAGAFGDRVTFGGGWNVMAHVLPIGDWDGNGRPDFYAVDRAGLLYLYLADASGRGYNSFKIGQGWGAMRQIMGIFQNLGGGLFGIDHSGQLFFYPVTRGAAAAHPAGQGNSRWLTPVGRITPTSWTVTPAPGWNGTKVRVVRLALGRGAPLNASMTFDRGTRSAVVRFQRRAGLRRTGVVDVQTWRRLTNRPWTMDNFQMWPTVGPNAPRAARVEALVGAALRFKGSPYTWGGAGPWGDGADCSGMVLQALYAAGIDPQPLQPVDDARPGYRLSQNLYDHPRMQHVPFSQRQRGDLIFWRGRYGIYHVAVYLGHNQVMESNVGYARVRGLYSWGNITGDVVRPIQ